MKNHRAIKSHFINSLIWRGKKLTAEKFFVSVLTQIKEANPSISIDVFYYGLLNLRPLVFLRPIKVGSVTYRTPAPISDHQRRLYALKFLFLSAKDSRGLVKSNRVATLLNSIYLAERNLAMDRKFALYKEAIDNRSFTRFIRTTN